MNSISKSKPSTHHHYGKLLLQMLRTKIFKHFKSDWIFMLKEPNWEASLPRTLAFVDSASQMQFGTLSDREGDNRLV